MLSQNELYNKLQFAKEKYTEYVLQVTERYSRGNINKKIPLKLNVLSNWLQYLEDRITVVVSSAQQDPVQIVIDEFEISLNVRTSRSKKHPTPKYEVLYIRDVEGKAIPISKFILREGLSKQKLLERIMMGANDRNVMTTQHSLGYHNNILVGKSGDQAISVTLKNVGSKFNNQMVKPSSPNLSFKSSAASQGRNAYSSGHLISDDSIKSYNNILDTIGLDLKFSYKDVKKDYASYTSINTQLQTAASITTMLSEAGINITDENNNRIKFE